MPFWNAQAKGHMNYDQKRQFGFSVFLQVQRDF